MAIASNSSNWPKPPWLTRELKSNGKLFPDHLSSIHPSFLPACLWVLVHCGHPSLGYFTWLLNWCIESKLEGIGLLALLNGNCSFFQCGSSIWFLNNTRPEFFFFFFFWTNRFEQIFFFIFVLLRFLVKFSPKFAKLVKITL